MKVPAPESSLETLVPTLALVGNPNTGKTTLFNALTGLRQKVGNYAGVTVEKKYGYCYTQHGKQLRLLDLPGSYSLNAQSPDESVVHKILLNLNTTIEPVSGILYVLDATQIERQLYLAIQLIELGWPLIIILTSAQAAQKSCQKI
jgi:ferrous iron transport protein B